MKKLILLFIAVATLISCNSNKTSTKISKSDMNANWGVESIENYTNPPTNLTLSLNLNNNTVKGFAGCNKFNGDAIRDNNKISFPAFATSRMMCPNADSETAYLNALHNVKSFKIKNNVLFFYDKNEKQLIKYVKL